MPWQNQELINLANQAKRLINEFCTIQVQTTVFIATLEEMREAVVHEQRPMNRIPQELEKISFELKYTVGRFFSDRNEVWLVDGKGVVLDVLIHELIHSFQLCDSHREHLVDYLTYKITNNTDFIATSVLQDWKEIKRIFGLKKILERISNHGDCEDFE